MPVIASAIVTGILALCFHSLCLFVLGICGGIAGLAVDQGIHIYTAYAGRMRIRRLASISLPLALSVITSAASFLVLLATGIVAYRQMGLFAALTLILNLFLSFTLLPTILKPRRPVTIHIADFRPSKPQAVAISLLWLVITIAAVIAIPKIQFNFSLQSMDGSSAETFRQEEELQNRWRSQDAGTMMVVTADSHDGVLDACDAIMASIPSGNEGDFSPSFLWPSTAARQRYLDTWTTPQTTQRLQTLQLEIRDECQKAKLPPAFFDGFFKSINQTIANGIQTPPPPLVQMVHRHLIHDYPNTSTALLFFRKCTDADTLKIVNYILPKFPNAALLSADAFQLAVSQDIRPRLRKAVIIIAPVLLLCLITVIRSPLRLLLVFTPGATAILWGLGLAAVCGFKLNLVNLISIVMLTGLVIDYGIFALHHARQSSSSIPTAMLLSALTTILTTGALLVSKHPVMFSTGLVLSFGILLTATTALFVIPSIVQLLPFLKHKSICLLLPLLLLFSSGCASLHPEKFPPRDLSEAERTQEINEFHKLASTPQKHLYKLTISILWYDIPMLLAVKTDAAGTLRAVATATNGVTLFSVSGKNFQEEKKFISDVFPDIAKRRLFNTLFDDLCHVFLPFAPDRLASCPPPFGEKPNETSYAGSPLRLVLLKNGTFPRRRWQTAYYGWLSEKRTFNSIVYKNFQSHYTFTFTLAN